MMTGEEEEEYQNKFQICKYPNKTDANNKQSSICYVVAIHSKVGAQDVRPSKIEERQIICSLIWEKSG